MPRWFYVLLIFSIAAPVLAVFHVPPLLLFPLAGLGILPLAALIGTSVEHIAEHTGEQVGGILFATFGNATELIIGIFALSQGLVDVVSASIIGSILGNALLVLGVAVCVGSAKHGRLQFDARSASVYASLLALCIGGLILPTVAELLAARGHQPQIFERGVALSDFIAVLLLLGYLASLLFSIFHLGDKGGEEGVEPLMGARSAAAITRLLAYRQQLVTSAVRGKSGMLNQIDNTVDAILAHEREQQATSSQGESARQAAHQQEEPVKAASGEKALVPAETPHAPKSQQEHTLPLWRALLMLAVATAGVAVLSELLVSSIEPVTEALHWKPAFVGLIFIPLIGGLPEYFNTISMALDNRKPSAPGPFAFFHGLSAWKRANEHLQFQATILENVSESIIVTDLQGHIIYWNEGATALFGYSAQDMLGNTTAILYPETEPHQLHADLEHIREGKAYIGEWKGRHKDGTAIWIDIKTTLLRTSEGAAIGFIGVAKDITARKQLEEQLRQSRDQLKIILQHVADGITVHDRSGALVYVNDAGARLSGFDSAQEMLTLDVKTLRANIVERIEMKDEFGQPISFADLPATKALQGQSYAEALVHYGDRQTGGSLWSVVKASPIFDETGQVQYAVNIFSDLTARMELEQRKDEFIGMASHELKTPITFLKGFTQLLIRKLKNQGLPEPVAMLEKMETQIMRLNKLVSDLLDVSKIRAGKLDYAEETIDFDALVHDIADTMQQFSTTHTITIHGASHAHIVGDSDRLGQVFTNLISNAVKYSPQPGQVDIYITVSQNMVTVSVRDYGVGIPKEHQQKIFDRFYRVSDVHDTTSSGLGMGLYISSEIVKRHGGRLWVESAENEGATFFISLPVA